MVKKIIKECHKAYGYIGPSETHKLLAESFDYPHRARIIRKNLKTCNSCQSNKVPTTGQSVTVESVKPEKPLDSISIYFFDPLTRTTREFQHILAIMNTFTKYTKLDDLILTIGRPGIVLSDRGTQFTCKRWEEALKNTCKEVWARGRY